MQSNAQFFKKAFDRQFLVTDPTGDGTSILSGLSSLTAPNYDLEIGNGQGTYQTLTGPMMHSLMNMYHGTSQISYLRDFVRISYNVQLHRDDKMQNTNQGDPFSALASGTQGNCSPVSFTPGVTVARPSAATWSILICADGSMKWYASAVYSGEIIYPMAEFVHLIKVEKPNLANINCLLPAFSTWGDYANWLEVRIIETIDAHTDAGFSYNSGNHRRDVYKTRTFGIFNTPHTGFYHGLLSDGFVAHNFSTAMARTYAVIHDYTASTVTRVRMQEYLDQLKDNWYDYADLKDEGTGYTWNHHQSRSGGSCTEEMSHGAYAVQNALLCYEYGIQDLSGGLLYDIAFIRKLVNTFTRNAYNQPLDVGPGVDGTMVCVVGDCYSNTSCAGFAEKQLRGSGAWLPLSASPATYNSYDDYIDRDIYNILMDVNLYYGEEIWPAGAGKTGTPPLNYSLMTKYYKLNNEILDPITAWRAPGNGSQWAGVDVGDVTGDGKEEIIAVRNYDAGHKLFALKVDVHPSYSYLSEVTSIASLDPGYLQFADVAVGDLDPTQPGKEIITATNLNGHLIMYDHSGGNLIQQASYTLANQFSSWKGITTGDFIKGNGKDEFVAVRNLDGKFFMFEYDPGTNQINGITSWSGPANYNWSRIACGDIDGDGYEDDIVCMNNATGNILTYYYDDGSNSMVPGANFTGSAPTSNWTDVAVGNFCRRNQAKPDIMVRRSLDGEMTIFREDAGQLVAQSGTFVTGGQKLSILGAGNFHRPNNKDELVALRNIDGDVLTFNVKSSCKITGYPNRPEFVRPGPGNGNGQPDQAFFDHPDFPGNAHGARPNHPNGNRPGNQARYVVPNPNNGRFTIPGLHRQAQVELMNASGVPVPFSRNGNEIDISSLSNGMYHIRIIEQNTVSTLQVIKQ